MRGGTGHQTSAAFERYLLPDMRDKIKIRQAIHQIRAAQPLHNRCTTKNSPRKSVTYLNISLKMEAAPGFEPGNSGFADHCLPTWLCRPEKKLERETGFEPATSTLARSHSTTELFPLNQPVTFNDF